MKKLILSMLLVSTCMSTEIDVSSKKPERVVTMTATALLNTLTSVLDACVVGCKQSISNMNREYERLLRKQEARFTSLTKCYEDFRHNIVNLDQNPKTADTTLRKCVLDMQETK